ncbi:MAG: hypothetical protein ACI4PB_04455, partial [Oscillospiraceae bacterium]
GVHRRAAAENSDTQASSGEVTAFNRTAIIFAQARRKPTGILTCISWVFNAACAEISPPKNKQAASVMLPVFQRVKKVCKTFLHA